MYAGYTQQLYEQGEVDLTPVTRDQISRVEDPGDGLYGALVTEPAMCTWYVSLNTATPPFDDPKVRQAFAHSVDRERYVEAITNGEDMAAVGLLPPGMPGFGASLDSPTFDPEAARALLAEFELWHRRSARDRVDDAHLRRVRFRSGGLPGRYLAARARRGSDAGGD